MPFDISRLHQLNKNNGVSPFIVILLRPIRTVAIPENAA